jgi:formylglycine-generating enzyme required for sulfatase activity
MPLTVSIKLIAGAAALAAALGVGSFREVDAVPFPTVSIALKSGARIEAGREEVTHGLWMECVADSGCGHVPANAPPAASYPVTDVNALDIAEFIVWLNKKTGKGWRLPTRQEAQEFADLLPKDNSKKLFTDPRLEWATDYYARKSYTRAVKPSGSFGSVSNGLHDIGGNVWEWTSTCVSPDTGGFMCPAYYVNGEHEAEIPTFLRDAVSGGCAYGIPPTNLGFRLVRDVSPPRHATPQS